MKLRLFFLFIFSLASVVSAQTLTNRTLYFSRGYSTGTATKQFYDLNNWATRAGINDTGDNSLYYNRDITRAASIPTAADYVAMVSINAGAKGTTGFQYGNDTAYMLMDKPYPLTKFTISGSNTIKGIRGTNAGIIFNTWDFSTITNGQWMTCLLKNNNGRDVYIDANITVSANYAPRQHAIENVSDSDLIFVSTAENPRKILVEQTTSSAKNTLHFYSSRRSTNSPTSVAYEGGNVIIYSSIINTWDVGFTSSLYEDSFSGDTVTNPAESNARGSIYLLGTQSNEAYFAVNYVTLYLGKTGGAEAITSGGRTFSILYRGSVVLLSDEQISDNTPIAYKNPRWFKNDPVQTEPITAGILDLNGFSERVGIVYLHYDSNSDTVKNGQIMGVRGVLDYGAGAAQYFCCQRIDFINANSLAMNLDLTWLEVYNYVKGEDHFYSVERLSTKVCVTNDGRAKYAIALLRFNNYGVYNVDYKVQETGPISVTMNGKTASVYEYTPVPVQ